MSTTIPQIGQYKRMHLSGGRKREKGRGGRREERRENPKEKEKTLNLILNVKS